MLERYYRFDTAKMLSDYNYNKDVLKSLKEQYKSLDGTSSFDYSQERVTSSPKPDALEKVALQRVSLSQKIADYEHDLRLIDTAIGYLDQDERLAIKEFFLEHQSKTAAVFNLSEALSMEQANIYRLRKQALDKLEQLIFG